MPQNPTRPGYYKDAGGKVMWWDGVSWSPPLPGAYVPKTVHLAPGLPGAPKERLDPTPEQLQLRKRITTGVMVALLVVGLGMFVVRPLLAASGVAGVGATAELTDDNAVKAVQESMKSCGGEGSDTRKATVIGKEEGAIIVEVPAQYGRQYTIKYRVTTDGPNYKVEPFNKEDWPPGVDFRCLLDEVELQ